MRVLALDTTTRAGSAALVQDAQVIEERIGDASRTHAERLPYEVIALLESRGLALREVDLFAVASGPGSLTGLRVGIATLQGLAFVTGRPLVGVSVLAALGHLGSCGLASGTLVAAWIDARRSEVFSALYRVSEGAPFASSRLVELDAPAVGAPAATLARWSKWLTSDVRFIGDGAGLYADVIGDVTGASPVTLGAPLLAGAIGRTAEERSLAGEIIEPVGLRPLYVRRPDAELARERRG